jgi:radical SAM/Cys-rich protein
MVSPSFDQTLAEHAAPLHRSAPEILQLNVGKLCNLTCTHCHVNAGPGRKEIITRDTLDRILPWFQASPLLTLDLTGGSPEMVPDFRRLIQSVRAMSPRRRIMDRLNATILSEPGYEWVAEFLAENEVELVASMPCYEPKNVTLQRGEGVFDRSIAAFQQLNSLGYGKKPSLPLHFVYNPVGPTLPPDQAELEADYKSALLQHYGIQFNQLYTITNMPISRFAAYLKRQNALADYLTLLKDSFNPATIPGLMCRNTLNVSWLGEVYDCDFNQMLELSLHSPLTSRPLKLWDLDPQNIQLPSIRTAAHCYGCTAGCGSSCGGALVD